MVAEDSWRAEHGARSGACCPSRARGNCAAGPACSPPALLARSALSSWLVELGHPLCRRGSRRPRWAVLEAAAVTGSQAALDDRISWPTATRNSCDLACGAAGSYSVGAVIDGKEKVYGSIP